MFTLNVQGGSKSDLYAEVRKLNGRQFPSKLDAGKAVKAAFGACFYVDETAFEKSLTPTICGFRFILEEF